jgi:hypothetical protein
MVQYFKELEGSQCRKVAGRGVSVVVVMQICEVNERDYRWVIDGRMGYRLGAWRSKESLKGEGLLTASGTVM